MAGWNTTSSRVRSVGQAGSLHDLGEWWAARTPSEQFGMRALSRGSGGSLSVTFATDHLPIPDIPPCRPLTNGIVARFTLGIPEGIIRHRPEEQEVLAPLVDTLRPSYDPIPHGTLAHPPHTILSLGVRTSPLPFHAQPYTRGDSRPG